ncbi:hypothetical protein [Mycolicibacterium iranicum]|uniref:Integrase n=1 Tax=Mycolicibacterium iranicum TaxID=912594 RepID=A0ABT4HPQ1_MYCIR|nr:hypothetical protein [Mycolicibacterium iranicum]MCZ0732208.1 hypothetical protein [Mycolicibacterium iranicum]
MLKTLSLNEYAAVLLGPGPDGTPATVEPFKIQWLTKRLRGEAKPKLPGYKAGRRWRATEEDVEKAITLLRPPTVGPEIPAGLSLTPTSRRRLGLTG